MESNNRATSRSEVFRVSSTDIIVALLFVQLILLITLIWRISSLENSVQTGGSLSLPSYETPEVLPDVSVGTSPPLGNPSASHVLVLFSNFNCGYCKEMASTLDELVIKLPDTVRVYYRHAVPLNQPGSFEAALALGCGGEQGRFWEMHDALFDSAPLAPSDLRFSEIAQSIDLDMSRFTQCMKEQTYSERITADWNDAQKYRISGTPTLFIDGRKYLGTQSVDSLVRIINNQG